MAMMVNVRAALAHAARREGPLGIVYATDARIEPGCGDRERQARDDPISGVSAVCGGQIDIPGLRLLGACKAHILNQRVSEDFAS